MSQVKKVITHHNQWNNSLLLRVILGKARVEPLLAAFYEDRKDNPLSYWDFTILEKTIKPLVNGKAEMRNTESIKEEDEVIFNVKGLVVYQKESLEILQYNDFPAFSGTNKYGERIVNTKVDLTPKEVFHGKTKEMDLDDYICGNELIRNDEEIVERG